jgi:hypothetical protein
MDTYDCVLNVFPEKERDMFPNIQRSTQRLKSMYLLFKGFFKLILSK